MTFDLGKLVQLGEHYAPQILGVVKGVRTIFGKGKTGQEKQALAKQAIAQGSAIVEGIAGKDVINDPAVSKLADESIELAYQIMQAEDRLKAIAAELKTLKGTGQPQGDGSGAE